MLGRELMQEWGSSANTIDNQFRINPLAIYDDHN